MAAPQKLFKDISAGKFKSAYYFYGSEDYRISEAVKFVAHQFLPDRQLSVNYRKIDAARTKTSDLITQLSTLPMLGEKQVFAITGFQSYKPTEIKKILSLVSPQDPNRIIIFTSPSSKTPKKSSAFIKTISQSAELVAFNRLTFKEAARQITTKLEKDKIKITSDALKLLTELLSGNRGALEAELTKLINYKNSGDTIEIEDIRLISSGFEVFNMFELADFVVAGQSTKVLQMIRSLISEGKSAAFLTTLLQQHFTSLYLVKNGKKPLGRRDFLIYKFRPQADKYSNHRLEEIIIEIAEADARLRQAGIKPETTLEVLALNLTRQKIKPIHE
ncbi:MAG: DNA polymerase III subunit delta [Candidatus Zixiibacteriota bacterium]